MDVEELRAQLKAAKDAELLAREQYSAAAVESKRLQSAIIKALWGVEVGSIVRETRNDRRRGIVNDVRMWREDEKPNVSVTIIKKDGTQGMATAHFYTHWEVEDGK